MVKTPLGRKSNKSRFKHPQFFKSIAETLLQPYIHKPQIELYLIKQRRFLDELTLAAILESPNKQKQNKGKNKILTIAPVIKR